jgi:hypothetical protein
MFYIRLRPSTAIGCGTRQQLTVRHSHAIAVPGCSSVLAGKLCTNEAIGAAKCSAVNRVRMSVPTWPAPNEGRIPEAGVGKMGAALQRAMQFIMQCIRGAAPGTRSACHLGTLA